MARPKHRDRQVGTYFITTATWERRSLSRKHEWAAVVEQKILQYRDKGFYHLHRYVVRPDHIHVLLTPTELISLERAARYIKGGSSREISVRFQSQFPVWQPGFTEHRIRDEADYRRHVAYIDSNPVRARLVRRPEEYPFGSAHGKYRLDPWPSTSGAKERVKKLSGHVILSGAKDLSSLPSIQDEMLRGAQHDRLGFFHTF